MSLIITLVALAGSAALAQTPNRTSPADDPNRMICRSSPETGSFVRKRRQCFTRAEWTRIAEGARDNATYVIENSTGRPCASTIEPLHTGPRINESSC